VFVAEPGGFDMMTSFTGRVWVVVVSTRVVGVVLGVGVVIVFGVSEGLAVYKRRKPAKAAAATTTATATAAGRKASSLLFDDYETYHPSVGVAYDVAVEEVYAGLVVDQYDCVGCPGDERDYLRWPASAA
jgi:hypothetical protein